MQQDYGERKCLVCGKDFKPRVANQVCCSGECQKKRDKALRVQWDKVRRPTLNARIAALEARVSVLEGQAIVETTTPVADDIGKDYEKALEEESQDDGPALDNEVEADLADEAEDALPESDPKSERRVTKEAIASAPKIDISNLKMQHCSRMKLDALHLPCGDRAECWRNGKCVQVPDGKECVETNHQGLTGLVFGDGRYAATSSNGDDLLQSYITPVKRGRPKKRVV